MYVFLVFFFIILFIFLLGEISTTIEAFGCLKDTSNQDTQKLLLEIKTLEEQHLAEIEKLNKINNDLLLRTIEDSEETRKEREYVHGEGKYFRSINSAVYVSFLCFMVKVFFLSVCVLPTYI